jgi:uncharacterized membrane protein
MALCTLSKPPQLAFVLLEAMSRSFKNIPTRWRSFALVVLPALVLPPLWIAAVSADVAAWRLAETDDVVAEQYSVLWKLGYMMQHPLHFPQAFVTSLDYTPELFRQLVGVLGWLDTALHPLAYPALGIAVVAVSLEGLGAPREVRVRLAAVSWLTVAAYVLAVFLVFFLVWSRIASERVEGVQGRYFLMALPVVAIGLASLVARGLPQSALATIAIGGALFSGVATLEALIRVNW